MKPGRSQQEGFQADEEASPRRRELLAAQRMAWLTNRTEPAFPALTVPAPFSAQQPAVFRKQRGGEFRAELWRRANKEELKVSDGDEKERGQNNLRP